MSLFRIHLFKRVLLQRTDIVAVHNLHTTRRFCREFSSTRRARNGTTTGVLINGEENKTATMRTNRLVNAKSPYLLQHAENPVDWYEWGTEAFDKAKKDNKPIFLSVGYSACHWCHVLAHESFEDEVTAKFMNENFVNIKVDREERPDVDRLYMTFLQATSGRGGWPMSVWLTPDLHPFFAGTYFPKGQFRQVLDRLSDLWTDEPERCVAIGTQVITAIQATANMSASPQSLQIPALETEVLERLSGTYDEKYGGFGTAPKFPSPSQTTHFLSRYAALRPGQEDDCAKEMAITTTTKIYNGGIRDVVGDGFARYSVDERWHVPHFEKMLYDQAQLLTSALEQSLLATPVTKDHEILQAMARSILTYVSRDLRSPEGAFYSAEDADSLPGKASTVKKEGAFYVWTATELDKILGEDSELFKYHFGVEEDGNCDPGHDIQGELRGQNVLYTAHTVEESAEKFDRAPKDVQDSLAKCLTQLREYRDKERPRPHLDDKIVTSWNGLMITGLSKAAEFLEEKPGAPTRADALALAEEAAAFIKDKLYDSNSGELRRSYREGPGPQGQADDYAFLIQGLLDLYEASGKEAYAVWAIQLQEKQDELFYDKENGGYFSSAPDEHILVRLKDNQDGAEPSATSVTLSNLCRLAHIAENRHVDYTAKAASILHSASQLLVEAPHALATMLSSAMLTEHGMRQFIVTGEPHDPATAAFLAQIRRTFVPNRVLLHVVPSSPPNALAKFNGTLEALIRRIPNEGVRPDVRICENFACGPPIYDPEDLAVRP